MEILSYYLMKTPIVIPSHTIILVVLLVVVIGIPAIFIHRKTTKKILTQRITLLVLVLFLLSFFFAVTDFDELKAYRFANKSGWSIDSFNPKQEAAFLDFEETDETNLTAFDITFDINQPETIAAMMCSEKIGLNIYPDYIGKPIKLYTFASSDSTSIEYEGILFYNDLVRILVGVYNHEIVFSAVFVHSPPFAPLLTYSHHYFPLDYSMENIIQEQIDAYVKL